MTCKFHLKEQATGDILDDSECYAQSLVHEIIEATDLSEVFDEMRKLQLEIIENFQGQNTPWVFEEVMYYDIGIVPHDPVSGSSYIKLPEELDSKYAIINVKNKNDHECFKWAVISAVFPKKKNHKD